MLGTLLLIASAADAIVVTYSPDVTVEASAGLVVADDQAVIDDQAGNLVRQDLGPLPESVAVTAMDTTRPGAALFSVDRTVWIPGSDVVVQPGDVVEYRDGSHRLVWDGSAEGLPRGARVDAVSIGERGLVMSFDTTVVFGNGLVVADEDLIMWDGRNATLLFDGSLAGIEITLDIDAAQNVFGGGFFVSFDRAGVVGSIAFADEDVLQFSGQSWEMAADLSLGTSDWVGADTDAISVPEPAWSPALLILFSLFAHQRKQMRPKSHWKRSLQPMISASLVILATALSTSTAVAGDGIIEINHDCATLTGCFPGDAPGYPVDVTGATGRSIILTSSLLIEAGSTDGIRVDASSVSIDLNGFIIRGPCGPESVRLPSCVLGQGVGVARTATGGGHDLHLRNGSVINMGGTGILALDRAEIRNVKTGRNGGSGISVGRGSRIMDSIVFENAGRGVFTGDGSVVRGNISVDNASIGYSLGDGNRADLNIAVQNGNDGFFARSGSVVSNNVANSNNLDGIQVSRGAVVIGNSAFQNSGDGFRTLQGSMLTSNTSRANGQVGMRFASTSRPSTSGYRGNLVTENGGLEISGGVDLGENFVCSSLPFCDPF